MTAPSGTGLYLYKFKPSYHPHPQNADLPETTPITAICLDWGGVTEVTLGLGDNLES